MILKKWESCSEIIVYVLYRKIVEKDPKICDEKIRNWWILSISFRCHCTLSRTINMSWILLTKEEQMLSSFYKLQRFKLSVIWELLNYVSQVHAISVTYRISLIYLKSQCLIFIHNSYFEYWTLPKIFFDADQIITNKCTYKHVHT